MNLFKRILLSTSIVAGLVLGAAGVVHAQTITTTPIFNQFDNVEGVGSEKDFLRIRQADGTKVDTIEACSGEVTLWFYIHNDQGSQNNGTNNDGPGVAHGTTVRIGVPSGFSKDHTISGSVSANNAATVNDTTHITCGGEDVEVQFVSVDPVFTIAPGGYTLDGNIAGAGAKVGYAGGVFPGCWDFRAYITAKVRIVKKPVVVVDKKCEAVNVSKSVVKPGESVTVTATGSANNATIQGYIFTVKNSAGTVVDTKEVTTSATTANYTFSQTAVGKYTVSASVKFADGNVTSANCEKTISVETAPAPTPTVIPDTGIGSMLGALSGVAIVGAVMHRAWTIRRASR